MGGNRDGVSGPGVGAIGGVMHGGVVGTITVLITGGVLTEVAAEGEHPVRRRSRANK